MSPAIKVEGLGKRYTIGSGATANQTFREMLMHTFHAPVHRWRHLMGRTDEASPQSEEFWALKDVNFEVQPGEVVGIIGRNGAGKSTLLKILSRITEQTEGRMEIRGRMASLLEVGTGFHPELTGHENIYLNGAILGMTQKEISRKFDEIVDFAEVEKFLNTPVKHYSSGMYVRLAFAVAAHLEPEILLVDEVLAVGDVAFQKKCLGKMDDVAKEGRTVLFVSHNMAAVRAMCQRCLLFRAGILDQVSSTEEAIASYLEQEKTVCKSNSILKRIKHLSPAIEIDHIAINGSTLDMIHVSSDDEYFKVEISGKCHQSIQGDIEIRIFDVYGNALAFYSPGHERGKVERFSVGEFSIVRYVELPRMNCGVYLVNLYLTKPGETVWMQADEAFRLVAEGTPCKTGLTFDYNKGAGWVFLRDLNDETKIETEKH